MRKLWTIFTEMWADMTPAERVMVIGGLLVILAVVHGYLGWPYPANHNPFNNGLE